MVELYVWAGCLELNLTNGGRQDADNSEGDMYFLAWMRGTVADLWDNKKQIATFKQNWKSHLGTHF